jgi:Protein of unknown function (DUF5661)
MTLNQLLEMTLKHGDEPDEKFDSAELKKGIAIEMEHTTDPAIAKQIAKAHLMEFPHYYNDPDGLINMEKKLEAKKGKGIQKREGENG